MDKLTLFLITPIHEANLSVLLRNSCGYMHLENIAQLVKLYLDKDERIYKFCGKESREEIASIIERNNISEKDFSRINLLAFTPYYTSLS